MGKKKNNRIIELLDYTATNAIDFHTFHKVCGKIRTDYVKELKTLITTDEYSNLCALLSQIDPESDTSKSTSTKLDRVACGNLLQYITVIKQKY